MSLNYRQFVVLSGVALVALSGYGCATKKYVRNQVDPVQSRVQTVEQKSAQNASSINDLEGNVSQVNERAMGANKKAEDAAQSAQQANQLATAARNRADEVGTMADQRFGEVQRSLENIDNFQQIQAEAILFGFNKANLTREGKEKLDQIANSLQNQNRYVIEVEGFTDRTGRADYNVDLSQRRADAVVRYLSVDHNVPLRRIHVLGAGEVDKTGTRMTRAARREARRVDVKVFGPTSMASNTPGGPAGTSGSADRSNMNQNTGTSGYQGSSSQSNQYSQPNPQSQPNQPGTTGSNSSNGRDQIPRQ